MSTTSTSSSMETLVLTDAAAAKVSELLEEEGNPELFLRVAVRPGGCSGFSYEMFFDTEVADDDVQSSHRRGQGRGGPGQRHSAHWAPPSITRTACRAPASPSITPTPPAPAAAGSPSASHFGPFSYQALTASVVVAGAALPDLRAVAFRQRSRPCRRQGGDQTHSACAEVARFGRSPASREVGALPWLEGRDVSGASMAPLWLSPPHDVKLSERPAALAEPVADRAHRRYQVGVLLAQLGPQPADVDVDGPGAAVVLVPPHPRQQRLPGEDLARVGGQELEQLVLHEGERKRAAGHRRLVRLQVEHQRPVLHELRPQAPARAPEQGARAGLRARGGRTAWTQKSSKRSSRSSRAPSCWGESKSSSGEKGTSRLRRDRHRAKAASGCSSAQMTPPDQPSSGSVSSASSSEPTAFQL